MQQVAPPTLPVELKQAIADDDVARVVSLMTSHPELHSAPIGYGGAGPLTFAAQCPAPPSPARLEIVRWLLAHGADVHEHGDAPLMRATLSDGRLPMAELLVAHGADVNARWHGTYPILLGPCECLAPETLRWLLARGAEPDVATSPDYGDPLRMLLGTYGRDPHAKHVCLGVMAEAGYDLPDTPAMALHAGRLDRLRRHLEKDRFLLARRFAAAAVYPPELGFKPGEGLHGTPVDGATLLHLAVEFGDAGTAAWLLERGADANARAAVDGDGFGGHTPLFHAVVMITHHRDDTARLLLRHGADPNARATLRKQLVDMGDPAKESMREFHNVTPLAYARQFQEPRFVNQPAVAAVREHGGVE
jgi:hypothetical protein